MTGVAINRGMCSGQGIVGIVNGECGWFPPGDGRMAISAGCRNVSGRVIRIRSGIIIGQMTYSAIFGKTAKGAVCMAPGAIKGMTQGQWEK